MASIATAFANVKDYFTTYVPDRLVRQTCQDVRYQWRERRLGPVVTTYLFLQQVLHGNTACTHLRHLSGRPLNPSAYCQARSRLPLEFFDRLQRRVTDAVRSRLPPLARRRWQRHRLFFLDGSSFSMPDTEELQDAFGQPGGQAPGCGFPTAHLLLSCQLRTGYIRKALAAPLRTHDLSQVPWLHPALPPNAVLVGDRAFCSFAHLALLRLSGRHGLFRAHQKLIVDFRCHRRYAPPDMSTKAARGLPRSRWLRGLGANDQLV